LRAAVSAAPLTPSGDRARASLAELYAAFEEGYGTADLAAARDALGVATFD
jgi:hypothetical protein